MRGMDAKTGTWLEGTEHLMQSIRLILATPINTRVMLPEFGSDVPNLISAPMTAANRLRLYAAATEAITRWEPRITVTRVEVTGESDNGEITLTVEGTYNGEPFSLPIVNVGVVMRHDSFWIKDLTIVLPANSDLIPVSKQQTDGSYGPDEAITIQSLLAMVQNVTFQIGTLSGDETPALPDEFAFSRDESGIKKMYRGTLTDLFNLAATIFVRQSDLEGHEDDLYASYESVMLDSTITDKRVMWCLTTDTSGAPQLSNQVQNVSSLNDGTYTLVLSTILRKDADSNAWPETLDTAKTAADYPSGKVIYIHSQSPYDTQNYIKCTLTTAGTVVGTGNDAYVWMTVEIDEIETFADGDWFRISESEPTAFLREVAANLRSAILALGNLDAYVSTARAEVLKFQAVTTNVGGNPNTSQQLSLDATTPVQVMYGGGDAEYVSGAGNASTFTVLKSGVYMISVSAQVNCGSIDRAEPYFQIQKNSGGAVIGETPAKYLRFAGNTNLRYYDTGFLVVDSDNTVCKLVALHDRNSSDQHQTYTVNAGLQLVLTRFF